MMTYNPYAPPTTPQHAPFATTYPVNDPGRWEVGDVFFTAWHRFKQNAAVCVATSLFYSGLALAAASVLPVLVAMGFVPPSGTDYWIAYAVTTVASSIVTAYAMSGSLRVFVAIARGEQPTFVVALGGFDVLFAAFVAHLLYLLGAYLGFLLFVVPGLMFMTAGMFASYFVADAKKGPIAAIAESFRVTKGQRLSLFGFSFLSGLLMLSGAFACGFGLLVTAPVALIATSVVYVRVSGRGVAPPAVLNPG
jgi:uncharacterized membrane protein